MPDYYFKKYPAKKVHFIRHGEAEHNKIPNYSLPDPKYYFPHAFFIKKIGSQSVVLLKFPRESMMWTVCTWTWLLLLLLPELFNLP